MLRHKTRDRSADGQETSNRRMFKNYVPCSNNGPQHSKTRDKRQETKDKRQKT